MARISDPIMIRNLKVKNRLYAAPMISNNVREDDCPGKSLLEATYFRAKGGWGIYCTEGTITSESLKLFPRMLGCYGVHHILALSELAEVIHGAGAKAMIQATHPGRLADPSVFPKKFKQVAYAPSDTSPRNPFHPEIKVVGMTEEDIEQTIQDFCVSIDIAKKAGFDLYNLHGSHGTLIQQFMSPYTNHRNDKWGGNWDKRLEFPRQLLSRMRAAVGDFPIVCRVCADEFMEGGYNLEDFCKYIVPALEEAGCDMFDVTCGIFEHFTAIMPEIYEPRGVWTYLAETVKKVSKVPVAGLSRINDGRLASRLIEENRFDIVGIGRGSLADFDFAQKTLLKRYDSIRQCIACNKCAEDDLSWRPSRCAVNFSYNRSYDWQEESMYPARRPKKIMVVGGGPAGMEFARVATLRGHKVKIHEKKSELGGYLPLAADYQRLYTKEVLNISRWLKKELESLNVEIELNKLITKEDVKSEKPDAVVLATGAVEIVPGIPGIDSPEVITLDNFLTSKKTAGKKVAILGGHYGAELAVSLSREGKERPEGYTKYHKPAQDRALSVTDPQKAREVFLIEEGPMVGYPPYAQILRYMVLNEYLVEAGVRIMTKTRVKEISKGIITYVDGEGKEAQLKVDLIILAFGRKPSKELFASIGNQDVEVCEIGDCSSPKDIRQAIHMANYLARQI